MLKLNRNLIEEEDSSELLENFIAVHIDRQRFETFCPRKTSDSFDKYDNKQTCT